MAAYDPAKLHPLADLGDKLDYLLLDDDKTSDLPGSNTAVPSRGWSDDLCYGTGTMYLSGAYKISFKLLFSSFGVFASGLDFSLTLSHLISNISDDPSLVLLLFYFVTCSPCVSRFGPRRRMGRTGRRFKATCRIKFKAAVKQYLELCHAKGNFHW